ncbi:MAG: protein kinase, partial [Stackebrandtia sp.]
MVVNGKLSPGDPRRIGSYRLIGRLGEGGMGQVFLARTRSGREVAVKLLKPQLAEDPEFRTRFAREVAAARQVGGLHTAAVVEADPEANPPWLATAFVPGSTLQQHVRDSGVLEP